MFLWYKKGWCYLLEHGLNFLNLTYRIEIVILKKENWRKWNFILRSLKFEEVDKFSKYNFNNT